MNDSHSAHGPAAMPPRPIHHNTPPLSQPGLQPPRAPSPAKPAKPVDEPLTLVEEIEDLSNAGGTTASKIKFGPDISHKKHEWKRTPVCTGFGACRVKSFHAKYSDQGLEHIDDAINEWLDNHAEVEVKFVTTTVHVFEGKIREPAIVMNLWY